MLTVSCITEKCFTVVSQIVTFPDGFFPGKTIPGWSLSRKDVSRVVIFPDETEDEFARAFNPAELSQMPNAYLPPQF